MHGDDIAFGILVAASAFDHEAIAQTDLVPRKKPEITFGGHFHEVFLFDPQGIGNREVTVAALGEVWMDRGLAGDEFAGRKIVDDQFQWPQDSRCARRFRIEVFTQAAVKSADVDPAIGLGDAGSFAK